jgi:hypothetical protein
MSGEKKVPIIKWAMELESLKALVEDCGSSPPGKPLLFFSPTFFSWQKVEEKNVGEKNKNCPGRRQTLEVFH